MLSVTDRILPGSINCPAIATLVPYEEFDVDTQVCTWHKLGYIPGVSTITGCARALLGIIHSIIHLASAIFDSKNRNHHLLASKIGGYNIVRGIVEMIPAIGNIICLVRDLKIAKKDSDLAMEYQKANQKECSNHVLLFVNGQKVGQKSFDELNEIAHKENYKKRPSFWQTVDLIQK
jgi:hypothetical protein